MKKLNGSKILPWVLFLVVGCGERVEVIQVDTEGVVESPAEKRVERVLSYLEEIVPPCVRVDGSAVDPCAPGPLVEPDVLAATGSFPFWALDGLPSFTEIFLDRDLVTAAVHMVVRGVPQIGTTRCDLYPIKVANFAGDFPFFFHHYNCFIDVTIKEYIVGKGPSELTVIMHGEPLAGVNLEVWPDIKDEILKDLNDPQLRTASAYEGKELILMLRTPDTITVEAFEAGSIAANIWFVQRTDNEIRAIAYDYHWASNEQERNQLNQPLDILTNQFKQAAAERTTITEGRIGIDSALPLLVDDANFLRDYYVSVGAVFDDSGEATVLPPPVPGEGDPVPVTVPVNEGEVTVVSSVPVPGEEVTVPPSDDAGLTVGQSTTTTVVDTVVTSTTTVVEPPVTTEVVPAVTTTSEVVENTTTTTIVGTTTVTGTTTTTVAPVVTTVTTVVSGGEDGTPLTEDGVPGEGQVSTTTSLVHSQSTTTTTGGEDGTPLTEDGVPGEGQVSTTTSLVQPQPTTSSSTTTLLDGDDIGPGEDSGIVLPADDGNEEEGQAGTGPAVDDG